MEARVISIEKSQTFGQEVNGQKRYIAVVTFVRATDGIKFASGAFGTNGSYKLSIDLVAVYADDENAKNDEGEFSGAKAFALLKKEYTSEGVELYDIDLGGTYVVRETGREMNVARIAIYGDEKMAENYAMRSLKRDIQAGRVFLKEETSNEEEE